MSIKVTKTLGADLLTPPQFAAKKKVSRYTVYNHVNAGKIAVVQVGMKKDNYIDWNKYKDYQFNPNMARS